MDNRALISISKKKNMEKDALIYILCKIICVDVSSIMKNPKEILCVWHVKMWKGPKGHWYFVRAL